MRLWEFPEDYQPFLIKTALSNRGKVIGQLETPYSIVYTLDCGSSSLPRYLVAKAPKIDASMNEAEIRDRLLRFLHEVNHIYRTCHLGLIQRFGRVEIVYGVPFLLSSKRHLTLRDAVEGPSLAVTTCLAITIQVTHAIAYIQSKGVVVHQDLKAENIFLDDVSEKFHFGADEPPYRYQAYVADLDMANAAMLFNMFQGSRPYMAPEQYVKPREDAERPDFGKVDIFAIGVNLYEMLTGGLHPIGERTTDVWPKARGKWAHEEVWKRWARSAATKLSASEVPFDPDLKDLILNCLQPHSQNRPTAKELEGQLFKSLEARDKRAHDSLVEYLKMVDRAETENAEQGWPYMDEMYSLVQRYFS